MERLDLGAYVGGVAQGAVARAAAKGVDLLLDPLPWACWVEADPNVLWRVFDNVLDNAVRHTPPGGQIRIRWMVGEQAVLVLVEDSGPGITPGDLARIFTPWFQGEGGCGKKGTGVAGLGLAIARRVVEAHGGTIAAENRLEGGARFIVSLPLAGVGLPSAAGPAR